MQITKGYTFGSTESVTANKLHTLVDSAVIASPLTIANIDAIIGGTTPAAGSFTDIIGTGTATFNDASNANVVFVQNDGTHHGIYSYQTGVLASNYSAVRVYSNAIQVNSPLIYVKQDNASSSEPALEIVNDGTGAAIEATGAITCTNIDGILGANTAAAVTGTLVTSTGGIVFPTSDPSVAGAWWDDAGTLTKSSG